MATWLEQVRARNAEANKGAPAGVPITPNLTPFIPKAYTQTLAQTLNNNKPTQPTSGLVPVGAPAVTPIRGGFEPQGADPIRSKAPAITPVRGGFEPVDITPKNYQPAATGAFGPKGEYKPPAVTIYQTPHEGGPVQMQPLAAPTKAPAALGKRSFQGDVVDAAPTVLNASAAVRKLREAGFDKGTPFTQMPNFKLAEQEKMSAAEKAEYEGIWLGQSPQLAQAYYNKLLPTLKTRSAANMGQFAQGFYEGVGQVATGFTEAPETVRQFVGQDAPAADPEMEAAIHAQGQGNAAFAQRSAEDTEKLGAWGKQGKAFVTGATAMIPMIAAGAATTAAIAALAPELAIAGVAAGTIANVGKIGKVINFFRGAKNVSTASKITSGVSTAVFGTQVFGGVSNSVEADMIARGETPDINKRVMTAAAVTAGEVLSEKVFVINRMFRIPDDGVRRLFTKNVINNLKWVAKDVGMTGAGEAIQEGAMEPWQAFFEQMIYKDGAEGAWDEIMSTDMLKRIGSSALTGALLGIGMGGGGHLNDLGGAYTIAEDQKRFEEEILPVIAENAPKGSGARIVAETWLNNPEDNMSVEARKSLMLQYEAEMAEAETGYTESDASVDIKTLETMVEDPALDEAGRAAIQAEIDKLVVTEGKKAGKVPYRLIETTSVRGNPITLIQFERELTEEEYNTFKAHKLGDSHSGSGKGTFSLGAPKSGVSQAERIRAALGYAPTGGTQTMAREEVEASRAAWVSSYTAPKVETQTQPWVRTTVEIDALTPNHQETYHEARRRGIDATLAEALDRGVPVFKIVQDMKGKLPKKAAEFVEAFRDAYQALQEARIDNAGKTNDTIQLGSQGAVKVLSRTEQLVQYQTSDGRQHSMPAAAFDKIAGNSRVADSTVKTAQQLIEKDSRMQGAVIVEQQNAYQQDLTNIMKELGTTVVFFESTNPKAPNGFYGGGNTLFVNTAFANKKKAAKMEFGRFVAFHEFFHAMKLANPDLFARIMKTVSERSTPESIEAYRDFLDDRGEGMTSEEILEEMVADEFGNSAGSVEFWASLRAENKGLFEELASKFSAFLAKLHKMLGLVDLKQSTGLDAELVAELQAEFKGLIIAARKQQLAGTAAPYVQSFETVGKYKLAAEHTTPHTFDKFDHSKMGTGEGNQSYGWGTYLSTSDDVREFYRNQFKRTESSDLLNPDGTVSDLSELSETGKALLRKWQRFLVDNSASGIRTTLIGKLDALDRTEATVATQTLEEVIDFLADKKSPENPVSTLKVDINVEDEHMLDWYATMDKQSNYIQQVFAEETSLWGAFKNEHETTGRDLYEGVQQLIVSGQIHNIRDITPIAGDYDKAASLYLNSLGIPGIKFLDGMSQKKGKGSYNYVIFDETKMAITDRYSTRELVRPETYSGYTIGEKVTLDVNGTPTELERRTEFDTDEILIARAQFDPDLNTLADDSPERQVVRDKAMEDLINMGSAVIDTDSSVGYTGDVARDKVAFVIMGGPAAGKSSVFADPLSQAHKALIIDSDIIKEGLPEFNGGLGAGMVHEESAFLAEAVRIRAMQLGLNVVLPRVGKSVDSMQALIQDLKATGYTVHLKLNMLPAEKGAERAVRRYYSDNRFVDPLYVLSVGDRPVGVFREMLEMKEADTYEIQSNDVAYKAPADFVYYEDSAVPADRRGRRPWESESERGDREREAQAAEPNSGFQGVKYKPEAEWDELEQTLASVGAPPMTKEYQNYLRDWSEKNKATSARIEVQQAADRKTWERRGGDVMEAPTPATREEYEGFKMDSTGTSQWDEYLTPEGLKYKEEKKGLTGYIAEMSPAEYIDRTAKQVFKSTTEKMAASTEADRIRAYAELMKAGEKFDMPVLHMEKGAETQEGRHRAYAAQEAGIELMPVLVVKTIGDSRYSSRIDALEEAFKDSKVRGKDGKLLPVYHGSQSRGFSVFDTSAEPTRKRTGPQGTYFTESQGAASNYAVKKGTRERGQMFEVFLNLENPLDITAEIKKLQRKGLGFNEAKAKALETFDPETHDGVMFKGNGQNAGEYIAMRPEQIKALNSEEAVDPANPDIRYSGRALKDTDAKGKSISREQQTYFAGTAAQKRGKLIPLYHGTAYDNFNTLDLDTPFYLAEDRDYARNYINEELLQEEPELKGRVIEAYALIKKPLIVGEISLPVDEDADLKPLADLLGVELSEILAVQEEADEPGTIWGVVNSPAFKQLAEEKGFDGLQAVENGKPTWAVFSSEQLKETNNHSPTENPDIRYSMRGDLVALHNISEDKILKVIAMGGMPVPSIAVTKADIPFDSFGGNQITLVGDRALVDPENPENKVYDTDVYSRTVPSEIQKVHDKELYKIYALVRDAFSVVGESPYSHLLADEYHNNNVADMIKSQSSRFGLKYYYLTEVLGQKVSIPMRPRRRELVQSEEALKAFIKANPGITEKDVRELSDDEKVAIGKLLFEGIPKKVSNPELNQKLIDSIVDPETGIPYFAPLDKAMNDIKHYGEQVQDSEKLRSLLDAKLKGKRGAEYEAWATELFTPVYGDSYFYDNRRKRPFDLYEIFQYMSGRVKSTEGFNYGAGNAKAKGAKKFNSIAQMHKAKGSLTTEEGVTEFKQAYRALETTMFDAVLKIHAYPNGFSVLDDVYNAMGDHLSGKDAAAALRKYDFNTRSAYAEEAITAFKNAAYALKNAPVQYFEAKPQRIVKLKEFKAALVHKSVKKTTVDALKEAGVAKVIRFETSEEKLAAMDKLGDKVRFSTRKYPIAPEGTWWGEGNYKAEGGKLLQMSPDEFLEKAKPLPIDEDARENIDDLKEHILSGKTLDPLTLYQVDVADVKASDGRHRAVAAKELGITKVPVVVYPEAKFSTRTPEFWFTDEGQDLMDQKEAEFVAELEKRKDTTFTVQTNEEGTAYAVVHPGTKGSKYQISFFDKKGPWGDSMQDDWAGVITRLKEEVPYWDGATFDVKFSTRTPAFDKWFGDSKVVDENGEPLPMYHGAKGDFTIIKPDALGLYFLTTDPKFAEKYNTNKTTPPNKVMPLFAKALNPVDSEHVSKALVDKIVEAHKNSYEDGISQSYENQLRHGLETGDWYWYELEPSIKTIKAEGYDGIWLWETDYDKEHGARTLALFAPNQIKDINNQNPTENPDIRYSTRTPAFDKWFGDSKVVDEKGEALIVYHGTYGRFNKFSDKKIGANTDEGMYGKGFYFTDDAYQAGKYGSRKVKAFLKMENPLTVGRGGEIKYLDEFVRGMVGIGGTETLSPELTTRAVKNAGYDGIIVHPWNGAESEYIVFSPNQIKSATDNKGGYDPENPDIRYSNRALDSFPNKTFNQNDAVDAALIARIRDEDIDHEVYTDAEAIEDANAHIEHVGEDKVIRDILDPKNRWMDKTKMVAAQIILQRVLARKDSDLALAIVRAISEKAKTKGQAIQALAMWAKLSPEGILRRAEDLIGGTRTEKQNIEIEAIRKEVAATTKRLNVIATAELSLESILKKLSDMTAEDITLDRLKRSLRASLKAPAKAAEATVFNTDNHMKIGSQIKIPNSGKIGTIKAYDAEKKQYTIEVDGKLMLTNPVAKAAKAGGKLSARTSEAYEFLDINAIDLEFAIFEEEMRSAPEEEQQAFKEGKTPAQILANRVKRTTKAPKAPEIDPVRELVNTLFQVASEKLPHVKQQKITPEELIALAIRDRAGYKAVWLEAKQLVREQFSEEALAMVQPYLDMGLGSTVAGKVKTSITANLKEMEVNLREVVKKFYAAGKITDDLVDQIIDKSGLTGAEADILASEIRRQMHTLTKDAKETELNRIFKEKASTGGKVSFAAQDIAEIVSLGGLEHWLYQHQLPKTLAPKIQKYLKQANIDLSALVKQSALGQAMTVAQLTNQLVEDIGILKQLEGGYVGLSRGEISTLARYISDEIQNKVKAKKQQRLGQMFGTKQKRDAKGQFIGDRIIEMSNLGAFHDAALAEAVAERLGMPSVSQTLINSLTEQAEAIQLLPDGYQKDLAVAVMLDTITQEVPVSVLRKIATFQTMAQLLNPVTIIRNVTGNELFAGMELFSKAVAVGLDTMLGGPKTQLMNAKTHAAYKAGRAKGWDRAKIESKLGVNVMKINRQDVPNTRTFRGGALGKAEELLDMALRGMDLSFYFGIYEASLSEQMQLEGVTEATDAMHDRAHALALYRTFQDDTVLSDVLSKIKQTLNLNLPGVKARAEGTWAEKLGVGDWGLGDMVLKYTKTPANLIMRGLDYSPVGAVITILKTFSETDPYLKKAMKVEGFARSIVGTVGLLGVGAMMAAAGLITGGDDDDKYFGTDLGLGRYKLNVSAFWRWLTSGFEHQELEQDDILVAYDWAQPMAIGLAIGADAYKGFVVRGENENPWLKALLTVGGTAGATFESTTAIMNEQSVLRGLKTVFGAKDVGSGLAKALSETLASFVPSTLNRVGNIVDSTRRDTYGDNVWEKGLQKAEARIPGLASLLPPDLSVFGETRQYYKPGTNLFLKVLGQLVSPAIVKQYSPTAEEALIMDLYTATRDKTIVPDKLYSLSRKVKDGDTTYAIPNDIYQQAFKDLGPELDRELRDAIRGGIRSQDEAIQIKRIKAILARQDERIRKRLIRDMK